METSLYNQEGKKTGEIHLPENVFGAPFHSDLVHQVVVSMQSNARAPFAHAKDRSEVSGGGKKPWRQKGTGRARHGSIRSPIWIGGGVTHGPRKEKNYSQKINKKMRAKALFSVLSQKLRDGEIFFIDTLSTEKPKTKFASAVLKNLSSLNKKEVLGGARGRRVLVLSPSYDRALEKSFRNIPRVSFEETRNLNPVLLLNHTYVIFINPDESFRVLSARAMSKKS